MNKTSLSAINRDTVVFLFINGAHHVHHLILPALYFAHIQDRYRTVLISGSRVNSAIIRKTWKTLDCPDCDFIELPKPLRYRIPNYKHKLFPPPYVHWKRIQKYIRHAAAVVSTSHEAKNYFQKYEITGPELIYKFHGAGTRDYSFEQGLNQFDLLLVPGVYYFERLVNQLTLDQKSVQIVGHPKFEWQDLMCAKQPILFNNNKPIFYYNPHWDMELSSFVNWSKPILHFFYKNKDYNLIFAPHPLLKHFSKRKKIDFNYSDFQAENILVDLDGVYGIDGTYCDIADVYIGDVSGIVTEWISRKPRPCVFINAHSHDWIQDSSYESWNCGVVIENVSDLETVLKSSLGKNKYVNLQENFSARMIYQGKQSASEQTAKYIKEFLYSKHKSK